MKAVTTVRYAMIYKDGLEIPLKAELADSFFKRFKGLMFRKSMASESALLLSPCNAIHTFSMRFPIDVVYLDSAARVVHVEKSVQPNKIGKTIKSATSILELNAGMAEKMSLKSGDLLEIVKTS